MSKPTLINKQAYLDAYKHSSSKKGMEEYLNNIGIKSSIYIINRFLKEENLSAPTPRPVFEIALENIDKNDLYNKYILQDWSVQECSNYFNVVEGIIRKLLNYYNIKKSKEQYYAKSFKTRKEHFSEAEINIKRQETILKKYGVVNGSQIKGSDEKRKQTFIKHYGSLDIYKAQTKNKIHNTFIEKYGSLDNFYTNRSKAIEETNLKRYGVKSISQREGWQQTIENMAINKYGSLQAYYDYIGLQKLKGKTTPEFIELYLDKNKLIDYLNNNPGISYSKIAEYLNVDIKLIYILISKFNLHEYMGATGCRSLPEMDLANELIKNSNIDVIRDSRSVLDKGKEIDIYLPSLNAGIEFNGTYWYSDLCKNKNYHFNKSKEAESKNIRLIHIWEYEWNNPNLKEKIRSLLNILINRDITKIYARKCTIKEITNKEAKSFNEINHLQGHKNAKITYGLFYNDELVQLMSFSPNVKYGWEMIRECTKLNTRVLGGCTKLFKYFLNNFNPTHVLTYCDFNKFVGDCYKHMGFKFIKYTGPDKKYVLNVSKGLIANKKPKNLKDVEAQLFGSGNKMYLWSK